MGGREWGSLVKSTVGAWYIDNLKNFLFKNLPESAAAVTVAFLQPVIFPC